MQSSLKTTLYIIIISLALAGLLFLFAPYIPFLDSLNWKIYDNLVKIEYKYRRPPAAINDILLVTIDNDTLENMPKAWPYPRSSFAQVIVNLKKSGARAIAFDFAFFGKSTPEDNALLEAALSGKNKVILAATIDEESRISSSYLPQQPRSFLSGFITKLQDNDGVTRKGLTFLVSDQEPNKSYLSWEMMIFKACGELNTKTLKTTRDRLTFKSNAGRKWSIHVDPDTKSYLINFRAHSHNFKRVSFYRVFSGDFDSAMVRDKIVMVGFLSSLLQDIHNTPIGWLPGLTLNANAFLTLYSHGSLKNISKIAEIFLFIAGLIVAAFFFGFFRAKTGFIFVTAEICVFFLFSYFLLINGYYLNYALFIAAITICPFLAKKMLDFGNKMWLNKYHKEG